MILNLLLTELERAGFKDSGSIMSLYVNSMARYIKSSDTTYSEKVKFLLKNGVDDYRAIAILNVTSVTKQKLNVTKKPNPVKGKGASKVEFEPDFYDKAAILNTTVDGNSLLIYNQHFEKMLRHNIIECCNLICKLDTEKENLKAEFEGFVDQFERNFLDKLSSSLKNLHIFEYDVSYQ